MDNLSKWLDKISDVLNKDLNNKKAIQEVIASSIGISLEEKDFSFKDGIIEIRAGGAVKNQINLKEEKIKSELLLRKIKVARILYK